MYVSYCFIDLHCKISFLLTQPTEKKNKCGGSGDPIFCFARVKMLLSYTLQQSFFMFNSLLNREKLGGDVNLQHFALQLFQVNHSLYVFASGCDKHFLKQPRKLTKKHFQNCNSVHQTFTKIPPKRVSQNLTLLTN